MSASASLGQLRIVPFLAALRAKHPALRIELRLEERPVDLVREGVDLAVRAGLTPPDSNELVALPLARFARRLVAAPSFLRAHGTPRTAADLEGALVVGGLRGGPRLEIGGDAVAVETPVRIGTLVGIREAAIAGLGFALLPAFVIADAVADKTLRVVLPDAVLAPAHVHAVHRIELRGHPRIDALVKHLRATLPA